jgi:uncharacterized protein (TIGR02145 family)
MGIIKSVIACGVLGISLLFVGLSCNKSNPISNNNNSGSITDVDGNVYQTVKIGNQEWMAENLRVTKYNDGSAITKITDKTAWSSCSNTNSPAYCYYSNTTNTDSIKKFGVIYNWNVVNTDKLAPAGWHVPDTTDWNILENYLIANGYNWDNTTIGNKIAKSLAAKTDWNTSSNDGAIGNDLTINNRSGFSALPGGYRDGVGDFYCLDSESIWWSTTVYGASAPYYRDLSYGGDGFYWFTKASKSCGFSVRLVRD